MVDWDTYFMTLAIVVSSRSNDIRTKHGSIIVDKYNRIVSVGYNGTPRGCDDKLLPLHDLDKKNAFMCHSESNAILVSKRDLENTKIYVSGRPCINCLKMIIQAGIKEIIYGPISSTMIVSDPTEQESFDLLVNSNHVQIRYFNDIISIFETLNSTSDYLAKKLQNSR